MKCQQLQPGEPLFLTPSPPRKSMRDISLEQAKVAQGIRERVAADKAAIDATIHEPSKIKFTGGFNYGR